MLIGGSMLVPVLKTQRMPKEIATAEAVLACVPYSPAKPESEENSPSVGKL